jgi:hypothetical protein
MRTPRIAIIVLMGCLAGCVERTMQIDTNPQGALLFANDQEIGRTPIKRDFLWYGNYDVVVRAEGYQTLKTNTWVVAPWWDWPPFDLFAELLPFRLKYQKKVAYDLEPASTQPVDAQQVLARASEMQSMLESSQFKDKRKSGDQTRQHD